MNKSHVNSVDSKKERWFVDIHQWITVRWENSLTKRYYLVMIEQDIFGQWVLIRVWGGIQTKLGRTQVSVLDNKNQGIEMLKMISIRRNQRGYRLIQ